MNMNKRRQTRVSGYVLVMIVCVAAIMSLMVLSLLSLGLNSRMFAIRTTQKIKARTAADAGLTKALFEMNEKLKVKSWTDTFLPQATDEKLPNFDAVFSYKVAGDIKNGFAIYSVGKDQEAEKEVYGELGLQGLFEHAILVKKTMILKSGTVVGGYDSKDLSATGIEAKIGTLSTLANQIVLNPGSTVKGDVFVGVDGDPSVVIQDLGGTTGDRYAATEEPPLPPVLAPVLTDMATAIIVEGKDTLILGPADSGKYTGIQVSQFSEKIKKGVTFVYYGKLEISGGDVVLHVTGDIEVGQGCEIIVKMGASLKLYIDGDIHCRNDSTLSNEGFPDPQLLQIFATGAGEQNFDIKAKSDWCGVVYAPNANIDLYAKGNAYGSIISTNFEYKAGGDFYYDAALKDVNVNDEHVSFVIEKWRER